MPTRNGKVAKADDLISLGDCTPELIACARIERDGETNVLYGYVQGRRCPGRIVSETEGLWDVFEASRKEAQAALEAADVEGDHATNHKVYLREIRVAYLAYIRDVLLTVVEGLNHDEAEIVVADLDKALAILTKLKWRAEKQEEQEGEGQGEETVPTGAPSSPS